MAKVVAVNISTKKGIQKQTVAEVNLLPNWGIDGDAHAADWHRQVSLLAQESIDKMKALGLPDLETGDFAENITTQGVVLHTLPVGTVFQIGDARLRVTQIGKECHQHCAIYKKLKDCIMPREGIFAEVLDGGTISAGMEIEFL